MHAHRFTQPAGVEVGGCGKEEHPEQAHTRHLQGQQFFGQGADRREVPHERQAGEQADGQPQRVLGAAAQELVQAPGRRLQLDPLVAFAFGDFLAPHEDPGPGALWAGVAAPYAAGKHGDREQAEGGDDQQGREQDEILGPEGRAKDVEFAFGKVPEHRLAAAPVQPHRAEEQQEQNPAPLMRRVRNKPVKLRVWIRLSVLLAFIFVGAGSNVCINWTGILSLMVGRSSASIWPAHYDHGTVCITDSGASIKTGSDAAKPRPCDTLMHPGSDEHITVARDLSPLGCEAAPNASVTAVYQAVRWGRFAPQRG